MRDIALLWDYLRRIGRFCLNCGAKGNWASGEGVGYRWHQCMACGRGYWYENDGRIFQLDNGFGEGRGRKGTE